MDNIIGFSQERIEETPSNIQLESISPAKSAPIIHPFSGKNSFDSIPIDYLPEFGVSTNPFTKKEVEKVLHVVMSGYSSLRQTPQHDI